MKPLIAWQKWKNPYSTDSDDEENNENYSSYNENNVFDGNKGKSTKAVLTPMGIIPLPEHSTPEKVFNLWMIHTNFNITPGVLCAIESTEGIETVDVFTRYRARIGIGKMFDEKIVIKNTNINVQGCITSGNTQ